MYGYFENNGYRLACKGTFYFDAIIFLMEIMVYILLDSFCCNSWEQKKNLCFGCIDCVWVIQTVVEDRMWASQFWGFMLSLVDVVREVDNIFSWLPQPKIQYTLNSRTDIAYILNLTHTPSCTSWGIYHLHTHNHYFHSLKQVQAHTHLHRSKIGQHPCW